MVRSPGKKFANPARAERGQHCPRVQVDPVLADKTVRAPQRSWPRILPKPFWTGAVLALLIAPLFCGCVTESQANARARAAYLAGQKAAFASLGGLGKGVAIIGPVDHPNVPWVEGLTLAQAIATANYTSHRNPKSIAITRQGEEIAVDPHDLTTGHVVPLQPGDTIKIRE